MHEVADEAGHGDRRLISPRAGSRWSPRCPAPEVLVAELERVEVAHDRVLLLGERLRVFLVSRWRPARQRGIDGGKTPQTSLQVRVGEPRLGRRGSFRRVARARDGGGLRDRRDERAGAAEGEGGDDSLHFSARGNAIKIWWTRWWRSSRAEMQLRSALRVWNSSTAALLASRSARFQSLASNRQF